MKSIMYNNQAYPFEDTAVGTDFSNNITFLPIQLFGVVLDNLGPAIIGAIHSEFNGTECWLPMRWDLYTGKHYDGGFNLIPKECESCQG